MQTLTMSRALDLLRPLTHEQASATLAVLIASSATDEVTVQNHYRQARRTLAGSAGKFGRAAHLSSTAVETLVSEAGYPADQELVHAILTVDYIEQLATLVPLVIAAVDAAGVNHGA